MENTFTGSLQSKTEALAAFLQTASAFLESHGLPARLVNAVKLVLEETLMNTIRYGYDNTGLHTIEVRIAVKSDEIHLCIEDDGRPFNPLTVPRQDRRKPAIDRAEDGLGIHLVRHIMRAMAYRREQEKNVFDIWIDR